MYLAAVETREDLIEARAAGSLCSARWRDFPFSDLSHHGQAPAKIAQLQTLRPVNPAAERLDHFARRPPSHSHDDTARQDRVWTPAKPCQRNRAISRDFLSLDQLAAHDAAARDGAPPVASVQQAAYFLVVFRLRTENRIDLVEQDRRSSCFIRDLAE